MYPTWSSSAFASDPALVGFDAPVAAAAVAIASVVIAVGRLRRLLTVLPNCLDFADFQLVSVSGFLDTQHSFVIGVSESALW